MCHYGLRIIVIVLCVRLSFYQKVNLLIDIVRVIEPRAYKYASSSVLTSTMTYIAFQQISYAYCFMKFPKVIAATVASDPEKYSEAFLGKTNDEYCAWILNSEKWGGMLKLVLF